MVLCWQATNAHSSCETMSLLDCNASDPMQRFTPTRDNLLARSERGAQAFHWKLDARNLAIRNVDGVLRKDNPIEACSSHANEGLFEARVLRLRNNKADFAGWQRCDAAHCHIPGTYSAVIRAISTRMAAPALLFGKGLGWQ